MGLLSFYSRTSAELLGLIWQHVYLGAVSTGAAILVGVPLGVALTRRAAWRAPVLGLANVFQTIPSLALFGFLIPVFGIGAWTAITALIVYALLAIIRHTYTGIAGVDPAVREAGRGVGLPDGGLLRLVAVPPLSRVVLSGTRP